VGTLTCHADLYDECGYNPPICELSKPLGEKAMPLMLLADRLTLGPPSIGILIDLLEQSEYVQAFLELVREYLPEHEREIMQGDTDDRAYRFCRLFGQRYFELDEDMIDGSDSAMAELCFYIPVRLQGLGYEQYHNFEYAAPSFILMLSLVRNPWVEPGGEEDAARVPILEEVKNLVGSQIAEQIPKEGWQPDELHRRLDGTKYEPIASFADWVWQDTGLALLDNDYECSGCGFGAEMPGWDRETVETLTAQQPEVREFWDNIRRIEDWLENSYQANFDEVLNFILEEEGTQVPKEQLPLPLDENGQVKPKTLMEVFSNEREVTDDDILEANSF